MFPFPLITDILWNIFFLINEGDKFNGLLALPLFSLNVNLWIKICHISIYMRNITWNIAIADPRVSSAFHSIVRETLSKNESPVIVIATTSCPRLVTADILVGFMHQFTMEVFFAFKNLIVTLQVIYKISIWTCCVFCPTGTRWGGKATDDTTAARRYPVRLKYQCPVHCAKNCSKLKTMQGP